MDSNSRSLHTFVQVLSLYIVYFHVSQNKQTCVIRKIPYNTQNIFLSKLFGHLKNRFWTKICYKTQTMNIKSIVHKNIAMNSYKPDTLAGFEPGSPALEATAVSSASRS
jgi:hypothetical protein